MELTKANTCNVIWKICHSTSLFFLEIYLERVSGLTDHVWYCLMNSGAHKQTVHIAQIPIVKMWKGLFHGISNPFSKHNLMSDTRYNEDVSTLFVLLSSTFIYSPFSPSGSFPLCRLGVMSPKLYKKFFEPRI